MYAVPRDSSAFIGMPPFGFGPALAPEPVNDTRVKLDSDDNVASVLGSSCVGGVVVGAPVIANVGCCVGGAVVGALVDASAIDTVNRFNWVPQFVTKYRWSPMMPLIAFAPFIGNDDVYHCSVVGL